MIRKRFHLEMGAAALVLLATCAASFADGPVPAGPCRSDGGCATEDGCATGCCKTCQPVQRIIKVNKRVYGEKCEDFCVCHPTFLGGLFNLQEAIAKDEGTYQGNCNNCGCGVCGRPHTKKFLVIRNREHEECQQKCEIPGQGPATGMITISQGEYPRPTTPALNPNRGLIVEPTPSAQPLPAGPIPGR